MGWRLPKVAATIIERPRVQAWLEFHATAPLRILSAPAGSGKTTAAVLYARSRRTKVAFVSLEPQTGERSLCETVGRAMECSPVGAYAQLVSQLAEVAPLELIVDNVDNASSEARTLLARLYLDVPDTVTCMYLARSEAAIPIRNALAQGLVECCDHALLAFDSDEVVRYAGSLNIQAGESTAARLCEATHGWALAVCGTCRTAAANRVCVADALAIWRSNNRSALGQIVDEAMAVADRVLASRFAELLAAPAVRDNERLDAFRAAGLFVSEWHGDLALNPLVRSTGGAAVAVLPAIIEMFGRFEMSIGGRPILWTRRRDRQIIAFLATRPGGRATRAEVITAFWPDADRQLAGQSLRTACSTIRRSICNRVGQSNVGRYFIGDRVLELVLENTSISSHEFQRHFDLAVSAYQRSDYSTSSAHLRSAQQLYRSPFLAGEPPATWTLECERTLAGIYTDIGARLAELSARGLPLRAALDVPWENAIYQESA